MKRYLRQTIFHPNDPTQRVTTVAGEESLRMSIWQAATRLRMSAANSNCGHLIDIEIFEHDGDLRSATIEAERRAQKRLDPTERNKNALYDFLIANFENGMLADGATISTKRPSPLSKEDILEVLMRAVEHPSYRRFRLVVHDVDGNPVQLQVDRPTQGTSAPGSA